jgi:hypothetical protein
MRGKCDHESLRTKNDCAGEYQQKFTRVIRLEGLEVFTAGLAYRPELNTSLYRPWRPLELREVEAPTFSGIGLIYGDKVVSLKSRPLLSPRKITGTHFCYKLSRPQDHSAAGRIR